MVLKMTGFEIYAPSPEIFAKMYPNLASQAKYQKFLTFLPISQDSVHIRQFSSTLQTPTRQSAKFRYAGSFLLPKARWGLFLLLPSFLPVGKQSQLLLQPSEVELGFSSRSGV